MSKGMQMNIQNPFLLLWFEGPLQAWGHDSKFGVRNTLNFPTRSGVLGLLCCAKGAGGAQQEWLSTMLPMTMQVHAFLRVNREGQRILREPVLRDFHMVGSGYDDSDPWQKLLIPKTVEGKPAVGGGSKMTYRSYLQDVTFSVIVEVPAEQKDILSDALLNPKWDLFLGRKNCVPTEFIFQGFYETADQAFGRAQAIAEQKSRAHAYSVVEGESDEGDVFTLNDVPLQFGLNKHYRDRQVTVIEVIDG
jgi:CRISPR system Cascade subunit CasD